MQIEFFCVKITTPYGLEPAKVISFKPAKACTFWGTLIGGSSKFARTAENIFLPKNTLPSWFRLVRVRI